jgi:glycosyltransferase involved in cell wall biosynthesis
MKISVCIPTFNQAQYLSGCVESVLKQTVRPDEIIVSNDCSTDGTKELLETLSLNNNIFKITNQPFNLGMNRNTDACLKMAKGEIILKLDSDDNLLPNYIETLRNLLLNYPDAGYAHAAVQEIDEHGNKIKIIQSTILFFPVLIFKKAYKSIGNPAIVIVKDQKGSKANISATPKTINNDSLFFRK